MAGRILITGVAGQLGHDVICELHGRGCDVIGSDIAPACGGTQDAAEMLPYASMDITDAAAVACVMDDVKPDAVIHCAAWTAVDAAQAAENAALVRAVNVQGTASIAQACGRIGAKMMYISTDYVFSGHGDAPWSEDCTDFAPLNVYGQTKLEGEQAVKAALERYFIVRTAWVFGACGKNFVKTMLQAGKKHSELRVVDDQIGTPTYTRDLARLLADMIATEKHGVYHATNEGGYISWADFAQEIFRQAGMENCVKRVTTQEYGLSAAARPQNSRLGKEKLLRCGFTPLPTWQDALGRYLREIGKTNP